MIAKHSRIVDRALTRLKLRQLRLLVAVGRQGNIQNAARELGISQPAATKMIQDLELDFEVKLFSRTNRGVIPTVFGETLIRHGKLIFAQVSNAAQELDDLNEGNAGRVVIGTLLAASTGLLPEAIDNLLKDRPKVAIKITEGTNEVLMPALLSGEIDLVVGRLPAHRFRDKITQETLFDDRIQAVVGPQHPLASKASVTFQDATPFGWVLPPLETTLRRQVDHFFISQDQYVPPLAIESVSYLANRALLQSRDLIGLMPAEVAAHDIERGFMCALDWSVPFGRGPVGVSYRSDSSLSPAGHAFRLALHQAAAHR
ncbi:LysR family transcriptional regulator [Sulfitobacter sp. M57]|uniref:LysR substrate-binding domain-containing protein n=1 Tax=unclassified Sulfitobacter TaxID=196795 RepID=UPI0023E09980|nr:MULTISPECIES: LysR substrate-binding domain-containing protein [unclassified Sulfitobacter]MDF3416526.1 LysR family transcriptional regulator [Sulfitobacter sp. KE5]MDF3424034.1 LysR family transcriptional regulator [Sulfitobacter sp. KE43]MDF3435020.1 LysR family transcriptional regulator [Sulfitobacter sp. KE42]MDF3460661.1 LysR family transcriptional regulator [Sulfitobacter sp. S74]MDF3464615.1 LysR family transcriptional regulator [Sulfitobacter sp. Ks18]